ncbi:MAG: hypothetical protein ACRC30_05840 [Clostridium sp.]
MNNAIKGMMIQSEICKRFGLEVCKKGNENFKKSVDLENVEEVKNIVDQICNQINDTPIELTTFQRDSKNKSLPYNLKLKSGRTLSIRTNKNGAKVAPRIVGQAGYKVLNEYFGDFIDYKIENQEDIKELILTKIDKILPIFMENFLSADLTVWINENDEVKIIEKWEAPDMIFKRSDLTFTKDTKETWKESTTLKYKGLSFAEIQVHKERSFKFRFNMNVICEWLKKQKKNNETLGMTAEKTICDIFKLERENHLAARSDFELEKSIYSTLEDAFRYLPAAVQHTGSLKGERGGASKCSYDFLLDGNKTLSLKTNYGKMVCPPEVGQPGNKTFLKYFGQLFNINEINNDIFKSIVLEKAESLLPIYLEHLLDSDYLLWLYKEKDVFKYKIIDSEKYKGFKFDKNEITFSRKIKDEWNSSNTIKYKGISLGEFQVHENRVCYKFRFNMKNLLLVLDEYKNNVLIERVAEE